MILIFFFFPGGDLLVSLTSAFDKKLKSLLISSDSVDLEEKQLITKSDDEQTNVQAYRDPSLHRSLERRSQYITEKHVSLYSMSSIISINSIVISSRKLKL